MAQTRLKQLREDAVLTVHELAEASGVSDDTISKIENGQRVARPSTLRKLAQALEVSPQELRRPAKAQKRVLVGKAEASDTGPSGATRELGVDPSVGGLLASFPYTRETASEVFAKATRVMRGVRVSVGDLLPKDARLLLTDDGEKVSIAVKASEEKTESWDAIARAVGIYAEEVSLGASLVLPFSDEPQVEGERASETARGATLERIKEAAIEAQRHLDDMHAAGGLEEHDSDTREAYEGFVNETLSLVEKYDAERNRV